MWRILNVLLLTGLLGGCCPSGWSRTYDPRVGWTCQHDVDLDEKADASFGVLVGPGDYPDMPKDYCKRNPNGYLCTPPSLPPATKPAPPKPAPDGSTRVAWSCGRRGRP